MLEVRRIVNQADARKDKKYKKFYIWATQRLLSMQLLNTAGLLAIVNIGYQIFQFWKTTGILMYRDIAGLIILLFYFFWFLPRMRFFLSGIKGPKVYGDTYELVITKDGYRANQQSFSWEGKKIVICKYGIAVLSFWNVLLMLPVHTLSQEEYNTLKLWLQN